MPATRPMLHSLSVHVTSDTICPFCFLGLRKLEQALALSPYIGLHSSARIFEPDIEFLPYQLDPSLPKDTPVDKRQHYAELFGKSKVAPMEAAMKTRGEEFGIHFSYGGVIRSTFLSHRLLLLAYRKGGWPLQHAFLNKVMPFYFEQEGDPGDPAALAQLAVDAGVFSSTEDATSFIDSDELSADVEKGFARARKAGIRGVPNFEIVAHPVNGDAQPLKAEIQGAQDVATFVSVFDEMGKRAQAWSR